MQQADLQSRYFSVFFCLFFYRATAQMFNIFFFNVKDSDLRKKKKKQTIKNNATQRKCEWTELMNKQPSAKTSEPTSNGELIYAPISDLR